MERLTTRNSAGVAVYKRPFECERCGETIYRLPDYGNGSPTDKLAAYEDADDQGLLLRLPCKVGDKIYQISENFIEPCTVETIFVADYMDKDGNYCNMAEIHYDRYDCPYTSDEIYFTDIGKTVFLTQEEAEAKLAEMEGAE